jgi:ParB family chromosome partitioning protein
MAKIDELRKSGMAFAAESMGAGLDAPEARVAPIGQPATPARLQGLVRVKNVATIPVDKIQPDPDQPRQAFDESGLDRLAESLKARGQIQPIAVVWDETSGSYRIVVGERRWRAAMRAGLTTLTAVIYDQAPAAGERFALQLVENALREDLSPVEQARAFQKLITAWGWSARELARELSIDNSSVIRALALLDLPGPVQQHVERGELSPSVAYEVHKLEDQADQIEVATRIVSEGLNRNDSIEMVKAKKAGRPAPEKPSRHMIKLDDGTRIIVEGTAAAAGEPAIADALATARKRILAAIRGANRVEAA